MFRRSPSAAREMAEAITAAARVRTRADPPPRGLPFFGLDHPSGSAVELLGGLASHGIFRKYEVVLDLSGHLGMSSRWLATVLGCTAVAVAPGPIEAEAAASLTRLAGLSRHVHHVATDAGRLPFGTARFTHVWSVEGLAALADPEGALVEAMRVLRPGGHLAIQELVLPPGIAPSDDMGRCRSADVWRNLLSGVGFVDLALRDVTERADETHAVVTTARSRFAAGLAAGSRGATALEKAAAARRSLSASLATRRLGLIQILARRP